MLLANNLEVVGPRCCQKPLSSAQAARQGRFQSPANLISLEMQMVQNLSKDMKRSFLLTLYNSLYMSFKSFKS